MTDTRDDVEESLTPIGPPNPASALQVSSKSGDEEVFLTPQSDAKKTLVSRSHDGVPHALSDLKEIVNDEEARYFSDLEESQKKVAELRASLKAYDLETTRLTAEVDKFRAQKETLEKERDWDNARLATENEILKEEKGSLEKDRDEQRAAMQKLRNEREDIERGHEEQKEKWKALVISMKCEYDKMAESDRKNREEKEFLKASNDNLKMAKEVSETEYKESKEQWQQTVQQMQEEFKGLKSAIAEQEGNYNSLKMVKEVAETEYKEAQEKWQQTVQQMQERFHGLQSVVAEQEAESEKKLVALQAKYDGLKQASEDGAHKTTEKFQMMIQELEAERDSLKTELNSFQLCRTVSHEDHQHKQGVWETKVSALQSQYDSLTASMAKLQSEYDDLKTAHQATITDLQQAQKMQPVYEKMKSQFMELKSAYEAQAIDLDRLTVAQEQAETALKDMKEAWKQESFECDKVKNMLASLQEDYDGRLEEMESHKVEHEAWELLKKGYESMIVEHEALLSDFGDVKDTVAAYQEEKGSLAKELTNMQSVNEALTSNLEVLREEVSSMHDAKSRAEASANLVQSQYDTLMFNFETVSAAAKQAETEHQSQKEMYQKKLAKANKVLETKKEAISMALQRYLEEVEAKQAVEEKASKLQTELEASRAANQELEETVASIPQFIASKDTVLDDLHCRFTHLERSMAAVIDQYKTTLEKKNEMEAKHKDEHMKSVQQVAALREAVESKEADLKRAQNESAALTKLSERKEAEVLSARCENDSLRVSLKEEKEKLTQVEQDAKQQISAIEDHVSALNTTIEKKDEEIESTKVTIDSLRVSLKEMRKSRENDVDELQQRISSMNHKVAQKITALNAAEIEIGELKADLDEAHAMIEKLEHDSSDVQNNANFSRELIKKQDNEIELIKARCKKLQSELEESEETRRTEIAKRESAEKLRDAEQADAEAALVEMKEIIEKKSKEVAELRAQPRSAASQKKISELQMLLEDKDAEIQEMKEKAESMNALLQKAKEAYLTESSKKAATDRKISEEHKASLAQIAFLEELLQNKESEVELIIARCENIQAALAKVEEEHHDQLETVKKEAKVDLEKAQAKIKELSKEDTEQVEVILEHEKQDELSIYKARCAELQVSLEKAKAERGASCYKSYSPRASAQNSVASRDSKPMAEERKNRWLGLRKREKELDAHSVSSAHGAESREERRARLGLPSKWQSSRPSRVTVERKEPTESTRSYTRPPTSPRKATRFAASTALGTCDDGSKVQNAIQAQIPAHIRSNFLEIGFYKQRLQNVYLPVLCLGPFNVPNGPIRDDWLAKIEKDSKVLSLGVHFYGKTGKEAYGTIPWFSFVPYEKAAQRGLDKVPKKIAEKMDAGETLDDFEKELVEGIKLVKDALGKEPELRTHPLYHLVDKKTTNTTKKDAVPEIVTTSNSQDHGDHVSEMGF